jgi:hypothetical protein
MSDPRYRLTDEKIERALRGRTVAHDDALLGDILRAIEASPQRQTVRWSPIPIRRRTVVLLAAALMLALLAGAVAVGSGILRPRPIVPPLPTPAFTALPAALDGHTWVLDFAQSGLSEAVPGCGTCSLGSYLTFENGGVFGDTGAGGGCDPFNGTYLVAEPSLKLSISPPYNATTTCYPGSSVQEIRARLGRVASFVLAGCSSSICEDLTLVDANGTALLVYRLSDR